MKRTITRILVILVSSLILPSLVGYGIYKYISNQPPKEEIKNALEAISAAKKVEAHKYAKKKLQDSDTAIKLGMMEWELQNKKFFIYRDFTKVRDLANQAILLGNEAWREASDEKDSSSKTLKLQLKRIQFQISQFERKYKNLPLSQELFKQFSKSRILYAESNYNFRKADYYEVRHTAIESERLITNSLKIANDKLKGFYKDYPIWEKNAQTAKKLSMNGQTVILISKIESVCYVLKSGKIIDQFRAEFGMNWMDSKIVMGDKATPDGIYKITQKKSGSKTKYYKSLLLNYPNNEDKARFEMLKKNGSISKMTKIGGLIEIHGNGGKGVNWTEGCIALENEEMDKIFDLVQINTPVVIIGSEKSLDEYLK